MPKKLAEDSINQALLNKKTKVFLMCCDMGSFSAVAEALHMTQSAISKIIFSLETELGITLFSRTTRPLVPTNEALMLQKHLMRLLGEFSSFMEKFKTENNLKPVLRVGMLESLSLNLGIEIVRHYLPEKSQLFTKFGSSDVLIRHLMERRLDLIITNYVSMPPKNIYQYEIYEEPSIFLLPKSFQTKDNRHWTWDRLAVCGLPLIRFGSQTGAGKMNNDFLRAHHLRFPEKINVEGNAFVLGLVKAGLGWTITRPTAVIQCADQLGDVFVAEMPPPVLSRRIRIIGRESEFLEDALDLKSFCENYLRNVIVPKTLEIAPWTKQYIRVGEQSI